VLNNGDVSKVPAEIGEESKKYYSGANSSGLLPSCPFGLTMDQPRSAQHTINGKKQLEKTQINLKISESVSILVKEKFKNNLPIIEFPIRCNLHTR